MDHTDKVVTLIDECREMGLKILPPNINTCDYAFTVKDDATILYGLGAIKGVGEAAVEGIVAHRRSHGPFHDLFDFCRRIDLRKANRRVLEALLKSGALDELGPGRATLMATLPAATTMAEHYLRDQAAGQNDLFGSTVPEAKAAGAFITQPEWIEEQRLLYEKETLGLYLTGHPITRYEGELAQITDCKIADIKPHPDKTIVIAGLVTAIRSLPNRRGERMAFVTLDDRSGRIEITVFAETYQRYRDLLVKERLLVVAGAVSEDEYSGGYKMNAEHIYDINQAREVYAKRLEIAVEAARAGNGFAAELAQILTPFRAGVCPVSIAYCGQNRHGKAGAQLTLGPEWRVHPTDELLHRLKSLAGDDRVRVIY
jgi:DNA polymerase-3 subunit alpha